MDQRLEPASTDWRGLCEELAQIEDALSGRAVMLANQGQPMDGFSALANFRDIAKRARAGLAKPEPERGMILAGYIHRQGNHWELSERPLLDDEIKRGWVQEPVYRAALPPVEPDCERNWDSILSPSGGYEMADDAALRDGAQLVNGEWWAPVFGCDSLESALARIRERLKRQAAPVPVAVCERDLDSILSPSGGYELREGAALTDGAQFIDGEWWAPVFGCDSVEHTLNRIRQRLDPFQQNGKLKNYQAFAPSPVPVSERLPQPEDCDAEGMCWWWYPPVPEQTYGYWIYEDNAVPERSRLEWPDSWLPAHALPLPSDTESGDSNE